MAIIFTYPTKATPVLADTVIITDSESQDPENRTKQTSIASIKTAMDLIDGTGTANTIPKWSDSNTLTDSVISESSSKIGIGTTSPDGLLHVSAGTQGDARLILEADTDNNDENDVPQIWFKADGDITEGLIGLNNNFLDIMSNESLQNGIRFFTGSTSNSGTTDPYTGATEKIRIIPTGELGIGTTSPTEKLEVNGNIKTLGNLQFFKEANSIKISTPSTITTSYELVMPAAVGTASQVLKLPLVMDATPYQLTWGDAGSGSGTGGFETLPFTTANGYITATGTYVFQMIAPSNCAPANFKFYNLLAQVTENTVAVAIYKGDINNGGSLQSTGQIAGTLGAAQISGSTLTVVSGATAISAGDNILVCLSFDSNISPLGVLPTTASGGITLTNASPVSNEKLALFDSTSIKASQFPSTISSLLTILESAEPITTRPFLLVY